MTFFSKNPTFDKLIEKATSHLLLEPDWSTNLTVCDMVRQNEVSGKYAVGLVKKKLSHSNPHVVIYALNLIESMAKNCGATIHDEIATTDFMNQMKTLVKEKDPVKSKVLELIQVWSHAFRHQPKYSSVQTTYSFLKSQGSVFPTLVESDAMFASETAPEWQDADCCYRCKIGFSTLKRKHHCRNCGNIFCDECTSKRSNIPKFGIEKDVRVCESCYEQLKGGPGPGTMGTAGSGGGSHVRSGRVSNRKGGHVQFNEDVVVRNFVPEPKDQTADSAASRAQKERDLEMQEKEELELALALSASEAESQEKRNKMSGSTRVSTGGGSVNTSANKSGLGSSTGLGNTAMLNNGIYSSLDTTEMDPELARYLNRNYWESKAQNDSTVKTTQPSAPIMQQLHPGQHSLSPTTTNVIVPQQLLQQPPPTTMTNNEKSINSSMASMTVSTKRNDQLLSSEQEEFLSALKSSIEIFINRMHSNHQRGRSIANDSAVQTLFLTLNAMHPELLQLINSQEDRRNYFEALQDKLAQLRDAREALDALREEHREKKRQQEEEAAKLRQFQMMQKLEIMRQKKQEFLDYQRQLAVDRLQQQEQEMAFRLAQQKQMMQLRQYQQQFPFSVQQQQNTLSGPNIDSLMAAAGGIPPLPQQQYQHQQQQFQTGTVGGAGIVEPSSYSGGPPSSGGPTAGGGAYGPGVMMVTNQFPMGVGGAGQAQTNTASSAAVEFYSSLQQHMNQNLPSVPPLQLPTGTVVDCQIGLPENANGGAMVMIPPANLSANHPNPVTAVGGGAYVGVVQKNWDLSSTAQNTATNHHHHLNPQHQHNQASIPGDGGNQEKSATAPDQKENQLISFD